jgi:hypothetical protein
MFHQFVLYPLACDLKYKLHDNTSHGCVPQCMLVAYYIAKTRVGRLLPLNSAIRISSQE